MGLLTDRFGAPLDSFLRSIPGYAGYASKERRRDADKALRTLLARRISEVAGTLQRMEREIATKGDLARLPLLERALQRLQHVADRLSTATYGYAPLFDAAAVREQELDQLYAFDSALAGHVETIEAAATALFRALETGAGLEASVAALQDATEQLNRQIDRRSALIVEGRLLSPPELSELLARRPKAVAVAEQLRAAEPGDAISVEGIDYVARARIRYREPVGEASLWLFDGSQYLWLELMAQGGLLGFGPEEFAPFPANVPEIYNVGGVEFHLQERTVTQAEVLSEAGEATALPVERLRYAAGDKILVVERWAKELKVKVLRAVDPGYVQVWKRTKGN
jgi:hypothetical protein